MRLRRSRYEWYIPAFGGNRARAEAGAPEATVCAVELRLPTFPEILAATRRGPLDEAALLDYVVDHIGRIRGLEVDGAGPDDPPIPITTGEELKRYAAEVEGDFLQELNQALGAAVALEAGLKKKSNRPPGSGDSPPNGDGTAAPVADTATTT